MTQAAQSRATQIKPRADGTLTYLVDLPPEELPPVRPRDLSAAWDAAREAANEAAWGTPRLFRFIRADGSRTDLALADPDASCWASAVDGTVGIGSSYGLSVCLRLLALVDLLAQAPWAKPLVTVRRDGAAIDPAALQAAATQPLTAEARFDHARFRAYAAANRLLSAGDRSQEAANDRGARQ